MDAVFSSCFHRIDLPYTFPHMKNFTGDLSPKAVDGIRWVCSVLWHAQKKELSARLFNVGAAVFVLTAFLQQKA